MMKNLFTSSSGSDSISCGIPRCIAGEGRDGTMESRGIIVSRGGGWGVEIKLRGWEWSSKNNKRHQKKSLALIEKLNKQNNKSRSKKCSFLWSINTTTNIKKTFFSITFSEPCNQKRCSVHVWHTCIVLGLMAEALIINLKIHEHQVWTDWPLMTCVRTSLLMVWQPYLHVDDMTCSQLMETPRSLPSCGLAVWYSNCIWQSVEGLSRFSARSGRKGGHMAPGPHL